MIKMMKHIKNALLTEDKRLKKTTLTSLAFSLLILVNLLFDLFGVKRINPALYLELAASFILVLSVVGIVDDTQGDDKNKELDQKFNDATKDFIDNGLKKDDDSHDIDDSTKK